MLARAILLPGVRFRSVIGCRAVGRPVAYVASDLQFKSRPYVIVISTYEHVLAVCFVLKRHKIRKRDWKWVVKLGKPVN